MRRISGLLVAAALVAVFVAQSAAAFELDEDSRIPPGGVVGRPYNFVFRIETGGGCPPYTFIVQNGQVPPGLTLAESGADAGTLSGTPTAAGTYSFWLQVLDDAPGNCNNPPDRPRAHTERLMTITIMPALIIDQQSVPGTLVNTPYSFQLTTSGGGTITWTLASGALPPGITLSPGGLLSGTPTTTGSYPFVVKADDYNTRIDTRSLTLDVVDPLTAQPPAAQPAAEAGRPFLWRPTATGGSAPYAWKLAQGSLPAGLTLDSASGTVSGKPTTPGPGSATLSVTDANGLGTTIAFAVEVAAKLTLEPRRLAPAKVGRLYRAELKTSGGVAPLRWKARSLPPGIRLDARSGALVGKPRQAGTFHVTIQVTDRLGARSERALVLTVRP